MYYDVANSTQMGYDIVAEIRQLGRQRICEFHAKENGFLLGQGKIDFPAVRKAMDDIGYSGWIQIEGAMPKGQPMRESYVENVRFMRSTSANFRLARRVPVCYFFSMSLHATSARFAETPGSPQPRS